MCVEKSVRKKNTPTKGMMQEKRDSDIASQTKPITVRLRALFGHSSQIDPICRKISIL